jgi:Na+-translocating ferredoxin:NAD+ oxidoreductase subunit G
MSLQHSAPPEPPVGSPPTPEAVTLPPDTPAVRLVSTLALSGALAGLLIVVAFQWAQPRIVAYQAGVLRGAVEEVLGAPARTDRLFVHDGVLLPELPAGVDSAGLDRVFVGYTAAGERVGFAIQGAEPGFADVISLIFGYDPADGRVIGMTVLDNKETPGLGAKIATDSAFVGEFEDVAAPLAGVKQGAGRGGENEVDMITGATISSRKVVDIVNHRVAAMRPLIDRYLAEGTP